MATHDDPPRESAFLEAVGVLGPALLGCLASLEAAQRQLHPPAIPKLRELLSPGAQRLREAIDTFRAVAPPDALASVGEQLCRAADQAHDAAQLFCESSAPGQEVARVLRSMHLHCRAQAALYPLRRVLPPVSRYFLEPEFAPPSDAIDPPSADPERVGIFDAHSEPGARGGFCLYVPEWYDEDHAWPLVVALHGGSGHGADFLWTWLREARGRGCLLLAPTSIGPTWSLQAPEIDARALRSMVAWVSERWRVDPERVLLTGLSDGATYSLLCGLRDDMPFTALAPVSGVLHPSNLANGNLRRARGRRIYLVHGALDWMFPVSIARAARDELERAGSDLLYREVEDLSHTYPREENARILRWLDPALGRPPAG